MATPGLCTPRLSGSAFCFQGRNHNRASHGHSLSSCWPGRLENSMTSRSLPSKLRPML